MDVSLGNFVVFPVGLRVLVVDDDPTCLVILEKMLRTCLYQVTMSNRAEKALSLLRENRKGYDIILGDVHIPDMDGFKLLEHVGLKMDLPVIMMSADDRKTVVIKGITHGACDYLIKPVRIESLQTIWKHVVRIKENELKQFEQSGSLGKGKRQQKLNEGVRYSLSANERNWTNSKRRREKEEEDEAEDKQYLLSLKKPRVVWSLELHQQFIAVVDQLGIDRAVPKKILEKMNVHGLTRENVASHLQKYRLYLGRISEEFQHHTGLGKSFMGPSDAAVRSMSSINGLDLQASAVAGKLPAQSLANLQAPTVSRLLSKSSISVPRLDQRNNIFSFHNSSKLRFGDSSSNSSNNSFNTNNQVNSLHGISTSMEPKQLANFPGINMQQNPRGRDSSPLRLQMNKSNGPHLSRMSSSAPVVKKSAFSTNGGFVQNDLLNNMWASGFGHNELISNVRASGYSPLTQPSPLIGLSSSVSYMGKGLLQDNGSSKESQVFKSGNDIFKNLAQHKSTSIWDLENIGLRNMGKGLLQNEDTLKELQGLESGYDIFNNPAQHKTKSIWDLEITGLSNMGKGLLQNEGTSKEPQGFESGYDIFNNPAQHKMSIWDLPNVDLSHMGKGLLQNEGISKEPQGFESGYDIFNNPAQPKATSNWDFQHGGLSFESTPFAIVQGNASNLNVQPSIQTHQGFFSGPNGAININGNGVGNLNVRQQFNTLMGENSLRVNSELFSGVSSQNPLFSDQHGQEDILSVILKQQQDQQEGIGPVPNDFVLDGFPLLDDFPF